MGLLDEIQQLKAQSKCCIVGDLINALEGDDRKELLIAINDPNIQSSKIVVALNRRGHKMSDKSMWKHRRKECNCVIG
jgi:hypothetical protein